MRKNRSRKPRVYAQYCWRTGKKTYGTHELALEAAGKLMALMKRKPEAMRAYLCKNCKKYHLTSKTFRKL